MVEVNIFINFIVCLCLQQLWIRHLHTQFYHPEERHITSRFHLHTSWHGIWNVLQWTQLQKGKRCTNYWTHWNRRSVALRRHLSGICFHMVASSDHCQLEHFHKSRWSRMEKYHSCIQRLHFLQNRMADPNGTNTTILLIVSLIRIILAIISILYCIKLSRAFGHGIGFAIGLMFLQPIFMLILGFGNDPYYGADR